VKAIVTIAIGDEYRKIAELSHPTIKKYADRIGADFICIDKRGISQTTPHWEKFQLYDILGKYDRVIYIDTDMIVRDDCPDLFEIVPEEKLGMFEEGQFTDRSKELMIDICKNYGITLPRWNGKYYNSGLIVMSKRHRELFLKPEKEIFSFYEQTYLNAVISRDKVDMLDLDYKFNRMTCMDRFIGEHRLGAYIVHYAGYPNLNIVIELIKKDLDKWKNGDIDTRKHIYISVSGGLGDQICAEPAIRFLKNNLYKNDEIIIATHFPRIFQHLADENISVCEQGKADLKDDTPYFIAETLPGPDKPQWAIVSHLLCHTVDYSSIALMKRTLPLKDRQIKFQVDLKDISNLLDASGETDFSDYVVVHPGKHWETKTFPVEWWQAVIDGLVVKGQKVCVIGKDERGDPPDFKAGARGTVDVDCSKVLDLRNKLDLGGLGALLSMAKTLVSNDSAPVHLAGAFDIEIVLIPSCKHPDHILPYRHETQLYKTKKMYKKLIIDEVESRPTQVYPTSVDISIDDWGEYLPDVNEIIETLC